MCRTRSNDINRSPAIRTHDDPNRLQREEFITESVFRLLGRTPEDIDVHSTDGSGCDSGNSPHLWQATNAGLVEKKVTLMIYDPYATTLMVAKQSGHVCMMYDILCLDVC